jgi:hypothetical protein
VEFSKLFELFYLVALILLETARVAEEASPDNDLEEIRGLLPLPPGLFT